MFRDAGSGSTHVFREEAASTLAGFHAGPLYWSNLNLEMLGLVEKEPEKNSRSKATTYSKLNSNMAPGWNPISATLVGGEHSHITAPSLLPEFWWYERWDIGSDTSQP